MHRYILTHVPTRKQILLNKNVSLFIENYLNSVASFSEIGTPKYMEKFSMHGGPAIFDILHLTGTSLYLLLEDVAYFQHFTKVFKRPLTQDECFSDLAKIT